MLPNYLISHAKGETHMSISRKVKRAIVYVLVFAVAFCFMPTIGGVSQVHAASALGVSKIVVKSSTCDLAGKDAQITLKANVYFNKSVSKSTAQKYLSITTSNASNVKIVKKIYTKSSKKVYVVSIAVKALKDDCKATVKIHAKKGTSAAKKGKTWNVSVYKAAESIYKNGKIYTVEGKNWENKPVEAMAVGNNGKILAVGSAASLTAKYKGKATKTVDLKKKTVFPGFIDSHNHAPGPGITQLYEISLGGIFSKEDTLSTIKNFVDTHTDMTQYFGAGYSNVVTDSAGNSMPVTKEWLDAICPDKPIVLTSFDYHNKWLNSKALEMCGITKDTQAPVGGDIKKTKDGELTGVLTDCSSLITLYASYSEAQYEKAFEWFFKRMNSWGYTGYSDAGTTAQHADMLIKMSNAGNGLPMRINYAGMMSATDIDGSIARLDALKTKVGNTKDIRVTTAKIMADGVVEGGTAYLWEPYKQPALKNIFGKDATDYIGKIKLTQEQLDEIVLKANAKGYPVHVHAIGDRTTTMTLDAIEKAQKQLGNDKCRNIITHLQVVDQDDIIRFKELGVIAACQVFWHFKAPDMYYTIEEPLLGKARAEREYPLNSFYRNNVVITASGDYPISPVNNPFWAIEIGVTRNLENADFYKKSFPDIKDITNMDDKKYLLNPDERVPLKAMIEAYTINGAYQMNYEDTCGSLKAGKVADFVIVDTDPFTVNPVKIDECKVLKTYKDGKVVFE